MRNDHHHAHWADMAAPGRVELTVEARTPGHDQLPPAGIDERRASVEADTKRFATIRAQAALAGFGLAVIGDPGGEPAYIAVRWGWSRGFESLADAETWLMSVGATS